MLSFIALPSQPASSMLRSREQTQMYAPRFGLASCLVSLLVWLSATSFATSVLTLAIDPPSELSPLHQTIPRILSLRGGRGKRRGHSGRSREERGLERVPRSMIDERDGSRDKVSTFETNTCMHVSVTCRRFCNEHVCVCVCVCARACVCACVCTRARTFASYGVQVCFNQDFADYYKVTNLPNA